MSDSVSHWTAAHQVSLSFTISLSLLKLTSFESAMPSNYLILCCPLLLLPSVFLSIRVFSSELALRIRWPKCWSVSFSISPSKPSRVDFLYDWLVWSCCPRVSIKVFSTTTVRKQQFFSAQPPFYSPNLTSLQDYWKNHSFDYMDPCQENGICESKSRKPCPSVGMKYLNVSLSLLTLLMILTVCKCVRAIM